MGHFPSRCFAILSSCCVLSTLSINGQLSGTEYPLYVHINFQRFLYFQVPPRHIYTLHTRHQHDQSLVIVCWLAILRFIAKTRWIFVSTTWGGPQLLSGLFLPLPNHNCWLVGQGHPSEKYEFVNWDDEIPNIWENKIDGNQTTNHNLHTIFTEIKIVLVVKYHVSALLWSELWRASRHHWNLQGEEQNVKGWFLNLII